MKMLPFMKASNLRQGTIHRSVVKADSYDYHDQSVDALDYGRPIAYCFEEQIH